MGDLYVLHILIITGIFIIAAMSLNLLLGYTGQLSLGHVAFFGIGAYTSSLMSLGFEVHLLPNWLVKLEPKPVWLGMLTGIVLAGACGWVIGKVSFKVRGAYFVIVSVSFAEVVRLVALNWVELTQGPMALNNIPVLRLGVPGWFEFAFLRKPANYYLVLVAAILSYVLIRRLVSSRAGRAMIALRENEPLATSVGVDVTRYLVLATMIAAAMAGAAGALYAHYVRIVDPDVFLFIYTVTMVIMVVAGGKGTLAGPIVGGLIFGLLPEVLRAAAIKPEVQWVVYGVLMILVVYFLPEGIVPGRAQLVAGPRQARGGRAAGRAPGRGGRAMNARAGIELAVDALTIRFGGLTAVDGATFEVRAGEVLSLIGPNGAGKTTAFNAITGFIELTGGHIAYRGQRLDGLKPNQIAALGVVRTFQKTSVFTGRSVHDNVAIGLHLRSRQTPLAILLGLPSVAREEKELAKEASQILRFVGLEARADQPASSLPYGELRLLEVAVALAAQPKLLLLDEPVSGMNPVETDSFMKLLAQIRAQGITVLLVEHDMKMVMGVSDRIVCLNHGRVIATGSPAEIQRNPEVVRAYLGERYARAHG